MSVVDAKGGFGGCFGRLWWLLWVAAGDVLGGYGGCCVAHCKTPPHGSFSFVPF